MIPLTVPEIKRLLAACFSSAAARPATPGTGRPGGDATKPAPAGTTSAHDSPATPAIALVS